MTPKSEPAPISEERIKEIERACATPCPSCRGEGKNKEGTWVCKPCAGTGCWLTTHGGFLLFQPARIAAYVDRKTKEFAEELLANTKLADDPFRDQIELNALNVFRGWTLALAHLHGVEIDYDKVTERVEAALHEFTDRKVRGALEEACKAQCSGCAKNIPIRSVRFHSGHPQTPYHDDYDHCHAAPIRALLAEKVKP